MLSLVADIHNIPSDDVSAIAGSFGLPEAGVLWNNLYGNNLAVYFVGVKVL
jgi:hypothetical protein